ncbi:MAG: hypothetical protein R2849_12515 [Thermomicrobiales bacterium]
MATLGHVDRDPDGIAGGTVVGGQSSGGFNVPLTCRLSRCRAEDDVRAGDVPGVQPEIVGATDLEGDGVVLAAGAANPEQSAGFEIVALRAFGALRRFPIRTGRMRRRLPGSLPRTPAIPGESTRSRRSSPPAPR